MKHTHILTHILFLTFAMIANGHAARVTKPSLEENCDFKPYVEQRLRAERAAFNTETEDFLLVDKRGLKDFNRQLAVQINSCYTEFAEEELTRTCNFNVQNKEFGYGRGIIQGGEKVGAEYWELQKEVYNEVAAFSEKKYYRTLFDRIKSCFRIENFKVFNDKEFSYLWGTLKALQLVNPELMSEKIFKEEKVMHGRAETSTKYTLRFEGLQLMYDDDGYRVEVSRDESSIRSPQRGGHD